MKTPRRFSALSLLVLLCLSSGAGFLALAPSIPIASATTQPKILYQQQDNPASSTSSAIFNVTTSFGDAVGLLINVIGTGGDTVGTIGQSTSAGQIYINWVQGGTISGGCDGSTCQGWAYYGNSTFTGNMTISVLLSGGGGLMGVDFYDIANASNSNVLFSSGTCSNSACAVSTFGASTDIAIAAGNSDGHSGTWSAGAGYSLIPGQQQFPTGGYWSASENSTLSGTTTAPLTVGGASFNPSGVEVALAFGFGIPPKTSPITVETSPSGLSNGIIVDGVTYSSTQTFTWIQGSSHNITAAASTSGYNFAAWSDSGARSHSITAPLSATTYTAYFRGSGMIIQPFEATLVGAGTPQTVRFTGSVIGGCATIAPTSVPGDGSPHNLAISTAPCIVEAVLPTNYYWKENYQNFMKFVTCVAGDCPTESQQYIKGASPAGLNLTVQGGGFFSCSYCPRQSSDVAITAYANLQLVVFANVKYADSTPSTFPVVTDSEGDNFTVVASVLCVTFLGCEPFGPTLDGCSGGSFSCTTLIYVSGAIKTSGADVITANMTQSSLTAPYLNYLSISAYEISNGPVLFDKVDAGLSYSDSNLVVNTYDVNSTAASAVALTIASVSRSTGTYTAGASNTLASNQTEFPTQAFWTTAEYEGGLVGGNSITSPETSTNNSGWFEVSADFATYAPFVPPPMNVTTCVRYTLINGGDYNAPVLTYSNGTKMLTMSHVYQCVMTTSASLYSVPSTLTGVSATPTQRGITENSTSGVFASSGNYTFVYWNQYLSPFRWSICSGCVYSGNPTLRTVQFGGSVTETLSMTPAAYWIDAGSPWAAQNPWLTDLIEYFANPAAGIAGSNRGLVTDIFYSTTPTCTSQNPTTLLEKGCVAGAVFFQWFQIFGPYFIAFLDFLPALAIYLRTENPGMAVIIYALLNVVIGAAGIYGGLPVTISTILPLTLAALVAGSVFQLMRSNKGG